MARARNIKPALWKNEDLAECSIWARFLFPGLWTLADREGRLEDRPKRIKAEVLPFDTVDVDPLLQELAQHSFIERYEVGGKRFIQVINFKKHQSPHYSESASVIPPPGLREIPAIKEAPLREDSGSRPVIKRGSQPPDSLIPDSLNPSASNPAPRSTEPRTAVKATRAGAIAGRLRAAGVQITPMHPVMLEWVEAGVTDEQFDEAIARARQHKPPPTPIPAKYLHPIVLEVMNPPPEPERKPQGEAWWKTNQGIDRMGRELGMRPGGTESYEAYKARIFEELKKRGGKAA